MKPWLEHNNKILSGGGVDTSHDEAALQSYFQEHINPNTVFFHDIAEKTRYMVEHGFWDGVMLAKYTAQEVKDVFKKAYSYKFRFKSFMGAQKFYGDYATKTPDKSRYLERYEDRMAITALARSGGNVDRALELVGHLVRQQFVPATPTLMNSGKANTGRLVSCFLLQDCTDSLDSIMKTQHFAADLSKNGGGVGIDLSNLRARGESLRGIENVTKGAGGVAKLFDVLFRYADQAGQRAGASVCNLSVMHPDFLELLSGKKIATDEDVRLKTLSICAVVPDVFMQAVKDDKDIYQVYPHSYEEATGKVFTDIDWDAEYAAIISNPSIRKRKVSARMIAQEIALTQGESGYPYLLFQGNANAANPVPNVGSIHMTNLCVTGETEVLTAWGYRRAKDLYDSQEDFDVMVDRRARDMTVNRTGLSREKSTRMCLTAKDAAIFKLTTNTGRTLRCTEWHKFYVIKADSSMKKIPLRELTYGDVLPVYGGLDSSPYYTERVVSIEPDGIEDVYDVTVENGNSVIFNGIATGNCSEILQPTKPSFFHGYGQESRDVIGLDISCNLASLHITNAIESGDFGGVVASAIHMLDDVARSTNIEEVPAVAKANRQMRSIGLGAMNLHGHLAKHGIAYGSPEAIEFCDLFFEAVHYHARKTSMEIARDTGFVFEGFQGSRYESGEYFKQYTSQIRDGVPVEILDALGGIILPTPADWQNLVRDIQIYGLAHSHVMALAPTGGISYVANATASVMPITEQVETRTSGKGKTIYPMPGLNEDTEWYYEEAYNMDMKRVIDTVAAIQKHVDQGISTTLFVPSTITTAELSKLHIYAFRKGLKTLYYVRSRSVTVEECVACAV